MPGTVSADDINGSQQDIRRCLYGISLLLLSFTSRRSGVPTMQQENADFVQATALPAVLLEVGWRASPQGGERQSPRCQIAAEPPLPPDALEVLQRLAGDLTKFKT